MQTVGETSEASTNSRDDAYGAGATGDADATDREADALRWRAVPALVRWSEENDGEAGR